MSKPTNTCHTGKSEVNNAAKLHHLFSKQKRNFEYFLTSMQYKIKNKIVKLSKSTSAGNDVNLTKKSTK